MIKEVTGVINHRILLNYRIDPERAAAALPDGLVPKIVNGVAIGGICQVSLSQMRPKGFPGFIGSQSHNAAHRIAVLAGDTEGVFVIRRDTSSIANVLAGGRLFPGKYSKAQFTVSAEKEHYRVEVKDKAGERLMFIDGNVAATLASGSTFRDTAEVANFFKGGGTGWSPSSDESKLDTITLETKKWEMNPLAVSDQSSAFFSRSVLFPAGTVEFDSAMIMRNLKHSWFAERSLCPTEN